MVRELIKGVWAKATGWVGANLALIKLALSVLAIAGAAWTGSHLRGTVDQLDTLKQVAAARAVEDKFCADNQHITDEVSDAYDKQLKIINGQLDAGVQRLFVGATIASPDVSPRKDHAAAANNRLYYSDPSAAISTLQRAAVASQQAEQLIGCQALLKAERE